MLVYVNVFIKTSFLFNKNHKFMRLVMYMSYFIYNDQKRV